MPGELSPEDILRQLEKGGLFPFYLFYGESEFLLERVLKNWMERQLSEKSISMDNPSKLEITKMAWLNIQA